MPADEVLFSLTKAHLESGLRGVPVGYCTTSEVDPKKGVFYVGEPIQSLAHRQPEEVFHLLLHKRWPSAAELNAYVAELRRHQVPDPRVIDSLQGLPRQGHPMKWLLHALNMMGMVTGTGDYRKDATIMTAQLPAVVAAIFRIRSGWGAPIAPRNDLDYMGNFVHMLGVPGLDAAGNSKLAKLMRVFAVLHIDHGGGNLSTFIGKSVASGLGDLYESLVAGMAGLASPRHGLANQECLEFVIECVQAVGGKLDEATVEQLIRDRLAKKQLIFGFGHAVLRVEDPRAAALCDLGEQLCPQDANYRMVQLLRKVAPKVLKENPKIANPYPNVDLGSGSLLMACGLKDPEYYTVLFGLSRCVGISAQIIYERLEARGGKGTPIIRPKYIYDPRGSADEKPKAVVED